MDASAYRKRRNSGTALAWLSARNDQRVIDLGSGDGADVQSLRELGIAAYGVDVAPSGRWSVRADAARLPFRDGAFERALSVLLLPHVPRREAVLGEVARVLRPGAIVSFVVFHRSPLNLMRAWQHQARRSEGPPVYTFVARRRWEEELRRAGLAPEDVRTTDFAPPGIDRLPPAVRDRLYDFLDAADDRLAASRGIRWLGRKLVARVKRP